MATRIGIDIGGTFTDLVFLRPDGGVDTAKVLSTPADYGLGIADGLERSLGERDAADIAQMLHGTTIATNANLEGRGAVLALITTEGFRDILDETSGGLEPLEGSGRAHLMRGARRTGEGVRRAGQSRLGEAHPQGVRGRSAGVPKCKGPMRLIAPIEDPSVILRILEHLGLWAPEAIERAPPLPPEARTTPCPTSRSATRGARAASLVPRTLPCCAEPDAARIADEAGAGAKSVQVGSMPWVTNCQSAALSVQRVDNLYSLALNPPGRTLSAPR
jgi:hypothetical protein